MIVTLIYSSVEKTDGSIILKMTGNPLFVVPYPTGISSLANLVTHTATYDSAMGAAKTRLEGTAEAEKVAEEVVHADCLSIMSMVQNAMDANKPNAGLIATNAGFGTKTINPRGKRPNAVFQATEPGCLIVWGEGPGQHEFQKSFNEGHEFVLDGSSPSGIYEARGLNSNEKVWFRSRMVLTRGRFGEWGPWLPGTPL